MKSSNNGRSWQPTLTLAKLFEEQNQFFDALAAYELISQNDSSPGIREKIESLQFRILSDPNSSYDPRIEKLFSPEELAYLKILNHQGFDNMSRAVDKLSEGLAGSDLYIELDELDLVEPDDGGDIQDILNEIEQNAQQTFIDDLPEIEQYTVKDLLTVLLSKYDKDQTLSEVKLSDFLALFLEMQSLKTKD
ncbi:MAG: hypothetical protein CVU49_05700 [Candidatus Cloacimonetes bacterium HGW-Cloacimonetes-2]|jgi:hypothetical protein|nr:MAG: hypothetical protein CVU49_05700 [Candidatus Cloacimonetes bacterium HGW-Cloacimonetes-2]